MWIWICRVVIAIGLVLHFLGHFGLWLGATRRIQLSYLQVSCWPLRATH